MDLQRLCSRKKRCCCNGLELAGRLSSRIMHAFFWLSTASADLKELGDWFQGEIRDGRSSYVEKLRGNCDLNPHFYFLFLGFESISNFLYHKYFLAYG